MTWQKAVFFSHTQSVNLFSYIATFLLRLLNILLLFVTELLSIFSLD